MVLFIILLFAFAKTLNLILFIVVKDELFLCNMQKKALIFDGVM